ALRLSEAEIKSEHGKRIVKWLQRFKYFSGNRVHVVENTKDTLRLNIYTGLHCHSIYANGPSDYLSGGASTRMPRPGESWSRGNDLPDGNISKDTLYGILGSIVFYEARKVAKDVERIADEAIEEE
ncbi:unnamed protein product, partial [marine sediment metagenome]